MMRNEYQKDLNQDQNIGFKFIPEESKGDLYKSETGSYVFDDGDYQLLLDRRGNIYNFGKNKTYIY